MSHPEKDELIFIKNPKFFAGVMGSPLGELKQFIHTPSIRMVDLDYYDIEEWDNVYIDKSFGFDDYTCAKKHYGKIIIGMPKWIQKNID